MVWQEMSQELTQEQQELVTLRNELHDCRQELAEKVFVGANMKQSPYQYRYHSKASALHFSVPSLHMCVKPHIIACISAAAIWD